MASGLFQPYDRIAPVAPSPSLLTSARPLPTVGAARAGAALVRAAKEGRVERTLVASVDDAVASLGLADPEVVKWPRLREIMGAIAEVAHTSDTDTMSGGFEMVAAELAPRTAAPMGNVDLGDVLFGLADQSWATGVAWLPIPCEPSYVEPRCTTYNGNELFSGTETGRSAPGSDSSASPGEAHAAPFTFYTPLTCDWTITGSRLDDDARALTDARTAAALSRQAWMGDQTLLDNLQVSLRHNAVDLTPSLGGAAVNLDVGVAALLSEYTINSYGLGGATIHLPHVMAVGAIGGIPGGGRVAELAGNYYRGALGAVVSPGPGYPIGASVPGPNGHGPHSSGTAEGGDEAFLGNGLNEVWVYVSGPVEYAYTPVITPGDEQARRDGAMRQNRYTVTAQRLGIVRFDPCPVYAIKVVNYAGAVS